jgi:hypothetical protein
MKMKRIEVTARLWYANARRVAFLIPDELGVNEPTPFAGHESIWMKQNEMLKFRVTYWDQESMDGTEKVYEIPRVISIRGDFIIEYHEPKEIWVKTLEMEDE